MKVFENLGDQAAAQKNTPRPEDQNDLCVEVPHHIREGSLMWGAGLCLEGF